jgi:pimeloyl-ACP methyl ester carboxylesterase
MAQAEKFVIDISDGALDDLRRRLQQVRLPFDFDNDNWRMGVNRGYLEDLIGYWLDGYDWRAQEARMNVFDNYRTDIDGMPIHFIHQPGVGPNPKPLILTHGWPWTFWDYAELIGPLSDPAAYGGSAEDAFHVIVPSLPGFGFSTPLTKPGMNFWRTADVWVNLMRDVLGYNEFFAAGGDFGNLVTAQLGHKYSQHVQGLHITGAIPLGLFSGDNPLAAGGANWGFVEPSAPSTNPHLQAPSVMRPRPATAHLMVNTMEPQTISYAMNDSPVALLAWLLQRRKWWSDNDGNVEDSFSRDFLLTTTMIYWLTESFSTSARYYAEAIDNPWRPSFAGQPVVQSPSGITFFDHDMTSQSRFWVEDYYNLVFTNSRDKGGHFAAAEAPAAVVEDIRATFRELR